MKTNLKRLIALFLTAAALSSLAACGSPSSSGSQEVPAVRVPVTVLWQKSRRSFITAWSPAPMTPFGMSRPERRLLRCLRACIAGIRANWFLARAREVSEDGLTYTTITLRDDIYWSDGEPVTSDDFIYSYAGAGFQHRGQVREQSVIALRTPRPITAVSATLLKLELKKGRRQGVYRYPFRSSVCFEELLAFKCYLPVRQDIVETYGESWSLSPETCIGNGPFKMVSYTRLRRWFSRRTSITTEPTISSLRS